MVMNQILSKGQSLLDKIELVLHSLFFTSENQNILMHHLEEELEETWSPFLGFFNDPNFHMRISSTIDKIPNSKLAVLCEINTIVIWFSAANVYVYVK